MTPSVEEKPRLIVQQRLAALEMWEDRLDHVVADDGHQEIMQHDPLIVPADELLDGLEALVRVFVTELIVEAQHCGLQLRDDHVLIVSGVPNQCPRPPVGAATFRRVTRHVARIRIGGVPGESASELEVPPVRLV